MDEIKLIESELVAIAELKPHPRNYRFHPDDQIEHIMTSIRENGLYRNVVIARDGTILAGHGVVKALDRMGSEYVVARRLDVDPNEPRALKVLAGDNEVGHLAEIDDRELSEILKEIKDEDLSGLIGTGYDEMMLANLVFMTRPESEILDFDAALEWVGMPEYNTVSKPLKITISFRNQVDKIEFLRILGLNLTAKARASWWPHKERKQVPFQETKDLRFEG